MHRQKRVLILDFDAGLLITLERLLEDSGFSTVTTWDVGEAVELLGTHSFDFLVTGHRPPELDATYLVGQARERGIECGCFVLGSGAGNQDGLSNLIDRIRAFPCSAHSSRNSLVPSDIDQELVGLSHGE